MGRWFFCFMLVFVLMLRAGAIVTVPFATTVVKPDGTPAVGASVLVRVLNSEDGSLREDRQLSTDEQGQVTADITFESEPSSGKPLAYALIDMPDYALVIVYIVGNDRGKPGDGRQRIPEKITLRQAYALTGLVVGPDQQPVAGAKVTVVTSGGGGFTPPSRFNFPSANIATPALCAVTDNEGRFSLRGLVCSGTRYGGGLLDIAVVGRVGDAILVGDGSLNYDLPPEKLTERKITLVETTSLHGTVLDAVTGKPINGIQVSLVPRSGAFNRQAVHLMVATSDTDGKYFFPGVPAIDLMVAQATALGYGFGWVYIADDGHGPRTKPQERPQDYCINLRPMVTVSGKLRDSATGKPIGSLPLTIIATYDNGSNKITGSHSCEASVAADGSYTLRVPAGSCTFRLALDKSLRSSGPMSRGFSGASAYFSVTPEQVEVTAEAILPFAAQRPNILFLRLMSPNGITDKEVIIMRVNEKEKSYYPVNGYYALPFTQETPITYRVERNKEELIPWSELVVDKNNWVQELNIP